MMGAVSLEVVMVDILRDGKDERKQKDSRKGKRLCEDCTGNPQQGEEKQKVCRGGKRVVGAGQNHQVDPVGDQGENQCRPKGKGKRSARPDQSGHTDDHKQKELQKDRHCVTSFCS